MVALGLPVTLLLLQLSIADVWLLRALQNPGLKLAVDAALLALEQLAVAILAINAIER